MDKSLSIQITIERLKYFNFYRSSKIPPSPGTVPPPCYSTVYSKFLRFIAPSWMCSGRFSISPGKLALKIAVLRTELQCNFPTVPHWRSLPVWVLVPRN